jgi:FMN reductase
MRFVTLVGNPKAGSRTATVAQAATSAVIAAAGVPATQETVDLSALACRLLLPQASAVIEDAVDVVLKADVLVVASPVFKATYTGLLKVFLDRLGYHALSSSLALPILVMKHPEHALSVEIHMRPLLVELGATVPTPGLAVIESDLGKLDQVLASWARRVAGQVTAKAAALGFGAAGAVSGPPVSGPMVSGLPPVPRPPRVPGAPRVAPAPAPASVAPATGIPA